MEIWLKKKPQKNPNSPKKKTTVSIFLCSSDNLRVKEFLLPIKKEVRKFFFLILLPQLERIRKDILFLGNISLRAKSQTAGNHSLLISIITIIWFSFDKMYFIPF